MKRVLFGALLAMLFVSCGKSLEEKANILIEDDIKKVLYHPETYDPAETEVDSAFTPFDDLAFYKKRQHYISSDWSLVNVAGI